MKRAAKYTYILHRILMGLILALSIVGAIINDDVSVKSIYIFNATESFLFLLASMTPTVFKKLNFEIPDFVYVIFVLFISAHFLMGEILGFYATVSWWDSLLHTFSGVMLTFLSFSMISLMNDIKNNGFKLNIYFSVLFAFALTITLGVIWEIVEFASDSLFGSNMQRAYESLVDASRGEPFVGQRALLDTMKDLMLDALGSFVTCIVCIILYKTKKIDLSSIKFIKRVKPEPKVKKEKKKKTSQKEPEVSELKATSEADLNSPERAHAEHYVPQPNDALTETEVKATEEVEVTESDNQEGEPSSETEPEKPKKRGKKQSQSPSE